MIQQPFGGTSPGQPGQAAVDSDESAWQRDQASTARDHEAAERDERGEARVRAALQYIVLTRRLLDAAGRTPGADQRMIRDVLRHLDEALGDAGRDRLAAAADRQAAAADRQAARPGQDALGESELVRLRARLGTMPVIERAKGIIMAQTGCGHAEAFDYLRKASQRRNEPVRELAARVAANPAGNRPAVSP